MIVHADITEEEKRELKKLAIDRGIPLSKLMGQLIRLFLDAEAKP